MFMFNIEILVVDNLKTHVTGFVVFFTIFVPNMQIRLDFLFNVIYRKSPLVLLDQLNPK